MNKNQSTTLERSIASFGADHDFESASVKSKKKNRSKKTAPRVNASLEFADETEDGWMPVVSKKTKVNVPKDAALSVSSPQAKEKLTQAANEDSATTQKKRRRRSDKLKSIPSVITAAKDTPDAVAQTAVQQSLESSIPQKPQRQRHKSNSFMLEASQSDQSSVLAYTHELEFLVSEVLGADAIMKTRADFPTLVFSRTPPITNVVSDPSKNVNSSDFIQMKAHLRAKEAECQVLRDEVVRMHTQAGRTTPPVSTIPLDIQSMPPPKQEQPRQQRRKSQHLTSKHIQCDIILPPSQPPSAVVEGVAEPKSATAPLPNPSVASIDSLVVKSLQQEIARLARENTLLSQRYANLETRFENTKKQLSKLQSEIQRAAAAAAKQAEVAVRQQMSEMLEQSRLEVVEKNKLLSSLTAELELAEQANKTNLQNLRLIQSEYKEANEILKRDMDARASEAQQHLTETLAMLATLKKERESAQHQLSATKAAAQSDAASLSSLRVQLAGIEAELEMAHSQCSHTKKELVDTQAQLVATRTSLDDLQNQRTREVSELKGVVEELKTRLLNSPPSTEFSTLQPAAEESPSVTTTTTCSGCAVLAGQVEGFRATLAATESALSHLQQSIHQEEFRWRTALQDSCAENARLKLAFSEARAEDGDQPKESCDDEASFAPTTVVNGIHPSQAVENGQHSVISLDRGAR